MFLIYIYIIYIYINNKKDKSSDSKFFDNKIQNFLR